MIEEIFCWEVTCIPFNRGAIRSVTLHVEAKNRKEAEMLVLNMAHKFFDQDMQYVWNEPMQGYRQVKET